MGDQTALSSMVIFDGRAVRLRVDSVRMPDGRETTREIVEHADCIAVIPIDSDGNVLLVSQFRYATGKELLEIPAGGIEKGEDAEAAVLRELREEIGYMPRKVQRLGGFYSAPGYCTEYLYLFLATDLVPGQLHAEDTEEIRVVRVPLEKVSELIASGAICDAKSIAGLLFYLKYRSDLS